MNARTKTLFHFTGKRNGINDLLHILEEGFWPQYSLEDITWIGGGLPPRLAWPMVSFCDIPISRLQKHTESYGNYGVGLCRERWRATGLNPVFYISPGSIVRDLLRELLLETREHPDPRIRTAGMVTIGNCKPLEDEKGSRDFYSECEWRFIPWVEGVGGENKYGFFLTEEEFHNEAIRKEANNERRKDRMLEFEPDEVRYLLVKSQEDVPALVRFIDSTPKLTPYSNLARDMLKTRIIVLNDFSCDF
jgi:hypothetical protein